MTARIGIVYYSMYGQTFDLAREVAAGIEEGGAKVELRRVRDDLPPEAVNDAVEGARRAQADVPFAEVDELVDFDGIVFGSPTRFGNRAAQLSSFLDQTGPLWAEGKLVGKTAGFFTGAATAHGGHETTVLTMSTYAFHMGMVIVGNGYADQTAMGTQTGGGPYGPSHLSPTDGSKDGLSDDERAIARSYGARLADITNRLVA